MKFVLFSIASLLAVSTQVHGHGVLLAAHGENGIETPGLGVTMEFSQRTGKGGKFQRDSSIIRTREIAKGTKASECGRTTGGGMNDIQSQAAKVRSAAAGGTYASVTEGKTMKLTMYQVNGDGAGPYTCQLSTSLDAKFSKELTIVQNAPGKRGNSRATQMTNNTIEVQIPMGVQCADACLVRCMNPAGAGPFGGCVPIEVTPANPGGAAPGTPAPKKEAAAKKQAAEEGAAEAAEESTENMRFRFFRD
ncbi:hypothetical protein BKA69DRAFT_1035582 [Paraphysoderma sedebokerense]|nr:hypothetical protein BKA69DRAFT_1035582 [Paraphysoderma sedebokerense]